MRTLIVTLIIVFPLFCIPQTTGTIKGKVLDKNSREGIPFANIVLESNQKQISGTASDIDGAYSIKGIKPGKYDLRVNMIGYRELLVKGIMINSNQTRFFDVELEARAEQLDEVVIMDYHVPLIDKDRTVSGGTVTQEQLNNLPLRSVGATATTVGGVFSRDGSGGNIRGARSCLRYPYGTESYDMIIENTYKSPYLDPLSTFSIDVDKASYSNMRRFINEGRLPPPNAVRLEELVNYFNYDYTQPQGETPFSVTTELSACPWNDNKLLHIGIQGRDIDRSKLPPGNLVFLIDVSGSMGYENKLPLLQKALRLLVYELRKEDRISIVVYAGSSGLVLPATRGSQKEKILHVIDKLQSGGSTAGGEGIQLAYKIARKNFIKHGNNRVILATDGDFNVGITSDDKLIKLIENERDDGIFLSVLGFGTGNLKDSKMEKLADHGNGNYAYIDNILEAEKVLVTEMGGTLFTIAKDVKIQIEFNPANVIEYRLIGYENRILADEDFNNDTKDAGEIGAGQSVTALYEIVTEKDRRSLDPVDKLRYQPATGHEPGFESELASLKIRYKEPEGDESKLITTIIENDPAERPGPNFTFSAAVAEFGMLLRESDYKGEASYDQVIMLAKSSRGIDEEGYRAEFIRLVRLCRNLQYH